MADQNLTDLLEQFDEDDEPICTKGDLLDFQQAILELAGEFAHLPIIGIVGALHTAAHVLTATAFDLSEDELGEEEAEDLGDGDGPLAVSFAVDD